MKNKLKDLNKILIIGFIGITLGLTGCDDEKDEIIEETGIKYTFSLSNSLPGLAPRITQESITFTKAEIRVIELVFDAEGPNGSISITEPLTSVINVIANVAIPELPVIELTPGTYTSINMGIELRDEDNTPSIDLEGIFSSDSIPFRFLFNSGEVFESDGDLLEIPDGTVMEARTTFFPSVWFANVTLTEMQNAEQDDNGVVVISESINTDIFDKMAESLDESTQATFPGAWFDND